MDFRTNKLLNEAFLEIKKAFLPYWKKYIVKKKKHSLQIIGEKKALSIIMSVIVIGYNVMNSMICTLYK